MLARSVNGLGPVCARTARMLNWAALKPTGRRKSSKCRLTSRDVLRTWKFKQPRVSSSRTVMALNPNDRVCFLKKPSAFAAGDNLRRSWASRGLAGLHSLQRGYDVETTGICTYLRASHMGTLAGSSASWCATRPRWRLPGAGGRRRAGRSTVRERRPGAHRGEGRWCLTAARPG